MKCIYYLAPSLGSTHKISDDLHEAGIKDWYLHVISKDESGLKKEHIHSSNYLETLDLIRDGFIGVFLGFIVGLITAGIMMHFEVFGADTPDSVYVVVVIVLSLFGAWEGGLTGIAQENKKLANFHDDIEAGKYLILIYARKQQESIIRGMMESKHGEADLVAVDSHFINPFSKLKRI